MVIENVPFKPHFGAFVLETLTLGMYGESRNAIREYIQNSFDSLRQAIADGVVGEADAKVEITLDTKQQRLSIRDNGGGLRTENAVSVLASVGASNKDYRRNAGFRGIGRLAGIVFCDRLVFTTKAAGQLRRTVVIFDAKRLREKMAPHGTYEADGTTLTIVPPMVMTLAAWQPDSPAPALLTLLEASGEYTVSAGSLSVRTASGTMEFGRP